jgi:hypothetical protein
MPPIVVFVSPPICKFHDTSIERKPRVLRFEASKGEVVVGYCEPLATKKINILGFPDG